MFEALGDRLAAVLKKISGRGVLRPEDVDAGLREVRMKFDFEGASLMARS